MYCVYQLHVAEAYTSTNLQKVGYTLDRSLVRHKTDRTAFTVIFTTTGNLESLI